MSSIVNIPDEFLCPIAREIMINPVIACDGITYDSESLMVYPQNGKPYNKIQIIKPNMRLKNIIEIFILTNKEIQEHLFEKEREKIREAKLKAKVDIEAKVEEEILKKYGFTYKCPDLYSEKIKIKKKLEEEEMIRKGTIMNEKIEEELRKRYGDAYKKYDTREERTEIREFLRKTDVNLPKFS